ncbi:MAG: stage III sporulation protein AB [bacterium]
MRIIEIVKIMCSGVILVGFSILGTYHSYKPAYRKNDLIEMKIAILNLISEINLLSSIEEAVNNIKSNLNSDIEPIFKMFGENIVKDRGDNLIDIWRNTLDKSCSRTYFTQEDIDKLYVIGNALGNFDKEFSTDSLNIVIDYIDVKVMELEEELSQNMRTYQSIGVLSGLAIIVVLM